MNIFKFLSIPIQDRGHSKLKLANIKPAITLTVKLVAETDTRHFFWALTDSQDWLCFWSLFCQHFNIISYKVLDAHLQVINFMSLSSSHLTNISQYTNIYNLVNFTNIESTLDLLVAESHSHSEPDVSQNVLRLRIIVRFDQNSYNSA